MDKIKVAVHDGTFHADEVVAIAMLKLAGFTPTVVRSRDPEELNKADLRVDVGGRYDLTTGDLDHHHDEKLPASCILMQNFLRSLGEDNPAWVHLSHLDRLLSEVSAYDCGTAPRTDAFTFSNVISGFNRPTRPASEQMTAFNHAVDVAVAVLKNLIVQGEERDYYIEVANAAKNATGKSGRIVPILKCGVPYNMIRGEVMKATDGFFIQPALSPATDWQVVSLGDEKLTKETCPGAKFVHNAGFLAVYADLETLLFDL